MKLLILFLFSANLFAQVKYNEITDVIYEDGVKISLSKVSYEKQNRLRKMFFFNSEKAVLDHLVNEGIFTPFTYLNYDQKCDVLVKRDILGKVILDQYQCSRANKVSLISYEFLDDKILAHYKEQTIELRYGERLGLIKDQIIVLKNDQLISNELKITVRNDEYVDFFLGKYKTLNEMQMTLFDKVVNFGSLKQTEYYKLNPQKFDHVLKLMRNLKGFESDKDQLKLLINHHLKRSQLLKNKHFAFQKLHHFYSQTENYFKRILDKLDK